MKNRTFSRTINKITIVFKVKELSIDCDGMKRSVFYSTLKMFLHLCKVFFFCVCFHKMFDKSRNLERKRTLASISHIKCNFVHHAR